MVEKQDNVEKIIEEWARTVPSLVEYLDNPQLLKQFYIKHHTAKTIEECIEDSKAELEVIIANAYTPQIIRLCAGCWKKECKEECDKEEYVERTFYTFSAGDKTGVINLRIVPWSNIDGKVIHEERRYRVKGKIGKKYNGTYDLTVSEIEPINESIAA